MSDNSRIHVTGYRGKLGSVLCQWFGCTPMEVDVTSQSQIATWLAEKRPEVVINCAAKSQVDFSETNHFESSAVNLGSVTNFIRASGVAGVYPKFIQLSTDYVFPGTGGPYSDIEPVKVGRIPSRYGLQKAAAEMALGVTYHNYVIARVTGLFGSYNGTDDLVSKVLDAVITGNPMKITKDLIGNPTFVPDLASLLLDAAYDDSIVGTTIHIAPNLVMSRYAFVMEKILPTFGLSQYSNLFIPVKTKELGWVAPRPTRGGLIPSYAYEITNSLEDALVEYGAFLGVFVND